MYVYFYLLPVTYIPALHTFRAFQTVRLAGHYFRRLELAVHTVCLQI